MKFEELQFELRKAKKYLKAEAELKRDIRFQIGHKIHEARIFKGMTQKQLAKKIGTEQPSIARVEAGLILPSLSYINKVARALGTYLDIPKLFGFVHEYHIDISSERSRVSQGENYSEFKSTPIYFYYIVRSNEPKPVQEAELNQIQYASK